MRIERPCPRSVRELVQVNAFLSETFGNLHGRKFCECSEGSNSPTFEGFQNFRRNGKNIQRQTAEPFCFGSTAKNRYSRKAPRRADCRIRIRRDCDIWLKPCARTCSATCSAICEYDPNRRSMPSRSNTTVPGAVFSTRGEKACAQLERDSLVSPEKLGM